MKYKDVIRLAKILDIWQEVKNQGINPEDVRYFGFDPYQLTKEEKIEANKIKRRLLAIGAPVRNCNPFNWPIKRENGKEVIETQKFNVVFLKNGEKIRLTRMIDRVFGV